MVDERSKGGIFSDKAWIQELLIEPSHQNRRGIVQPALEQEYTRELVVGGRVHGPLRAGYASKGLGQFQFIHVHGNTRKQDMEFGIIVGNMAGRFA